MLYVHCEKKDKPSLTEVNNNWASFVKERCLCTKGQVQGTNKFNILERVILFWCRLSIQICSCEDDTLKVSWLELRDHTRNTRSRRQHEHDGSCSFRSLAS